MRGYFAIGAERISKPMNLGSLLRTAHAFGASFFFTIQPTLKIKDLRPSDTSDAADQLPLYHHQSIDDLQLPRKCQLVGVELSAEATLLPSFRHPTAAAYILGPERGSLSPETQARCDHIVQIPMKFCVNVGVAGAIVMYDRVTSLGRFDPRPVRAGAPTETLAPHVQGAQLIRRQRRRDIK